MPPAPSISDLATKSKETRATHQDKRRIMVPQLVESSSAPLAARSDAMIEQQSSSLPGSKEQRLLLSRKEKSARRSRTRLLLGQSVTLLWLGCSG